MIYEDIFKPHTFDEYVGQESAKKLIRIMLDAADAEDRFYPNVLLVGPPGLGKTSLAKIMFGDITHKFTDGKTVNSVYADLNSFVIIDEIHNTKDTVCDFLNTLIDDERIIIIGCTTNPGLLPAPFRSRFQIVNLVPYSTEDLVTIMRNVLERKGTLEMDDGLLTVIAERSRQTPRTALRYLAFTMDLMAVREVRTLSADLLAEAFDILGVDEKGLLEIDHQYLQSFPPSRDPVGIQYLSSILGYDKETIEQEIEPYLMQLKLIDRTPRGRVRIFENETINAADLIFGRL